MSDQAEAVVGEAVSAEPAKEDFKLGIKPLDETVHKIDQGARKISESVHGVKSVNDAVHLIDAGVRKISQTAHKAVDSVTKR